MYDKSCVVKPFGFELDDKRLKRAGLDYWKHISVNIYENLRKTKIYIKENTLFLKLIEKDNLPNPGNLDLFCSR